MDLISIWCSITEKCPALGQCEAGQFTIGAFTCADCPQGWASDGTQPSCVECSSGEFAKQDPSVCVDTCDTGYEEGNSDTNSCEQCAAGKYGTETGCVQCPSGKFLTLMGQVGVESCSDCPQGYQANSQSSGCGICPAGTESSLTGGCTPCTGGYKDGECVDSCPNGQIRDSMCVSCDKGHYTDGSTCIPCAKGSYNNRLSSFSDISKTIITSVFRVPRELMRILRAWPSASRVPKYHWRMGSVTEIECVGDIAYETDIDFNTLAWSDTTVSGTEQFVESDENGWVAYTGSSVPEVTACFGACSVTAADTRSAVRAEQSNDAYTVRVPGR